MSRRTPFCMFMHRGHSVMRVRESNYRYRYPLNPGADSSMAFGYCWRHAGPRGGDVWSSKLGDHPTATNVRSLVLAQDALLDHYFATQEATV